MGTPIWKGASTLLDAPNSPEYTFGESVAIVRTLSGPHALCLSSAPMRGAIGTGLFAGYRVVESKVSRGPGAVGTLIIRFETNGQPTQGAQLPPDETSMVLEKIERPLAKHSIYDSLSDDIVSEVNTMLSTSRTDEAHKAARKAIDESSVAIKTLALKLFSKMRRGFTHYPLYVPVFSVTLHYWGPPTGLHAGGVLQSPPTNILTLPAGLDWLREGDSTSYNGTHWQLTRRWIGAPDLDSEIYP